MDQSLIVSYLYAAGEGRVEQSNAIAGQITNEIFQGNVQLLELVQAMGNHLTDDDEEIRKNSMGLLADVLNRFESDTLTSQQIKVMLKFLCDRADDEICTGAALQGILALVSMDGCRKAEVLTLMETLFATIEIRKHSQYTRFSYFQIHETLLRKHRDFLKAQNDDYIACFSKAVEGEKDPRNLMASFSIIKVLLVEFDIRQFVQDLFDVTFCYFPITFRPPPDDPYHITAEDLKIRLRQCIAATDLFAGLAIPSLLEKLNVSSPSIKKDALETLSACARNYGAQTLSLYANQIWESVKFEVLHALEDDLADESLRVLAAITITLSAAPSDSHLSKFLSTMSGECAPELREPHQKQGKPAGKIIAACAQSCILANTILMNTILPPLFHLCNESSEVPKRRAFIELFTLFLDAYGTLYGWEGDYLESIEDGAIVHYKTELLDTFRSSLIGLHLKSEISLRLAALKALAKLAAVKSLLSEAEVSMIIGYMDKTIIEEENKNLCDEALKSLSTMSQIFPTLVLHISFPALLAQLPDEETNQTKKISPEKKSYQFILSALANISSDRPIFEALFIRLMSKLDHILLQPSNPQYAADILGTILSVLRIKEKDRHSDLHIYLTKLVPALLSRTILPFVHGSSLTMATKPVLHASCRIFMILLRTASPSAQEMIYKALFDLFIYQRQCVFMGQDKEAVARVFDPLHSDASDEQKATIALLTYAVAGAKPDTALPLDNITEFVFSLIRIPRIESNRLAILHLVAILVNKFMSPSDSVELVRAILFTNTCDLDSVLWVTKALCLRLDDPGACELLGVLFNLSAIEALPEGKIHAYDIIFSNNELLSKLNYANIRVLAKQKYFSYCLPRLLGCLETQSYERSRFLIALVSILRHMPMSVILPELGTLLPVLLQSLDLADPGVKSATLDTICTTMVELPSSITSHLTSLIPKIIDCTILESNPASVRTSALRCLSVIPLSIGHIYLIPLRKSVTQRLGMAVDDPKRSVRKEAIDARQKWYSIDDIS